MLNGCLLDERRFGYVGELAEAVGMDPSQLRRQLNLTLLWPEMVRRVLDGAEPECMSLKQLLVGMPTGWEEQGRRVV